MRSGSARGQVLVLAALTISLTILSTQAYIYRLSRREASAGWSALGDYVLGVERGSRHVVVASLINVSRGGAVSNLEANLRRWEAFVDGDYRYGRCRLNATPASQEPYSGGIWLDWGTSGRGVSSAYAEFTMNLSGRGAEVNWSFAENITTTLIVSGSYETLDQNQQTKKVTVVVNILNEGDPALAESIALAYLKGNWRDPTQLESYSWRDFGNGTYRYSFVDTIPGAQVQIRAEAYDRRGVFVQAETSLDEG